MNELVQEMINARAHFIQNYAHNVYHADLNVLKVQSSMAKLT